MKINLFTHTVKFSTGISVTTVKENFLFCEDLKINTTAKDMMQLVKDYFLPNI